jgi:hypothetical protein
MNKADFIFHDKNGEVLVKKPGSIRGFVATFQQADVLLWPQTVNVDNMS